MRIVPTARPIAVGCLAALTLMLSRSLVAAEDADLRPPRLLAEAHRLAREIPKRNDWAKTLILLRVADTMRLCGLKSEAQGALDDCRRNNAEITEDAIRDEITIETCRLLVLLGQSGQAETLAATAKFRGYSMPARYLIARTKAETDTSAAISMLHQPCFVKPDADGKGNGDLWRRAAVRIALEAGQPELATQLIAAMTSPLWKSGALGDLAVAHVRAGRRPEALKTALSAPDAYMTVIGLARVAEAIARRSPAEPLKDALDALLASAKKVTNAAERDFALGVGVNRLVAAGRCDEGATVADRIGGSIARARAECELLSPGRLSKAQQAIAACPQSEQPLLEELLALACARRGMPAAALDATSRIRDPWQRCRAQATAARALSDAGHRTEAVALAEAAAASADLVKLPGWQIRARLRVALDADRAGLSSLADRQFRLAVEALVKITDADLRPGLTVAVAEALATANRAALLRDFAIEVLKAEPSATTRNRLLPVLAAAGQTADVVAECQRAKPSDSASLRTIIYRLAMHGQLAHARALATGVGGHGGAEALADIALAQYRPPTVASLKERPVGVTLHGTWNAWFPRLERMGIAWELMPFTEPYELGAAGLAAKYRAVGYPGTGGHEVHTGTAGMENLRDYLCQGGGLVGICAGQYLATRQHYVECDSIHMGCPSSPHQVQMRKPHLVCLGLPEVITISRRNGGILIPRPGCEVLGWYDTIERYAALVAQDYGYGRAVAFSPHPEGSGDLDSRDLLCINAIRWAMGEKP